MSLWHMSGFEGAPKGPEVITSGITYAAGGRTGMCMVVPGGQQMSVGLPAGMNEIIFGIAVKPLTGYDTGSPISIQLVSPAVQNEFYLSLNAGNQIRVVRRGDYGEELVLGTIPAGWALDTYSYLEVHFKLAVAGFAKVWLNGTQVVDYVGNTLGDTDVNRSTFNTLIVPGPANGGYAGTAHFDDFYILTGGDGSGVQGRPFNTPIGMPKIELLPVVGNGDVSQWVGSDGNSVDNYQLIDEIPPSATDYVESSTTGQRDMYHVAAPTTVGDILALDVTAYAASPDGGVNPLKSVRKLAGGTEYVGPGLTPSTTYKNLSDGATGKDPSGADWTPTSIGNATFGIEVG